MAEGKKSRYVFTGPFSEFWFRLANPNKTVLELRLEEKVWNNVREGFNAYLGKVFEEIAKEYIVSRVKSGELEIDADVMRRWQNQAEEIDFIAYSSREKEGVLFEIKMGRAVVWRCEKHYFKTD